MCCFNAIDNSRKHYTRSCLLCYKTDLLLLFASMSSISDVCGQFLIVIQSISLRFSLDFSNSISLWRRMKPETAVFSGNRGKFDRVGALWFEVRGLRVRRRPASRNASPGGRAPSLGAAERHPGFLPGRAAQEELKARRRYR
jgi:hypothetical protein